jgi:hypothetical protein
VPVRDYQALILQSNYRLIDRWTVDAHWTVQLREQRHVRGRGANTPGGSSFIGDYPEVYPAGNWDRQNADGRFNDFQRHKLRAWTTYA